MRLFFSFSFDKIPNIFTKRTNSSTLFYKSLHENYYDQVEHDVSLIFDVVMVNVCNNS